MNIFTISRSEIEDRLDPKYILYLKNSRTFKYKVSLLKNFFIEKPKYGTAEPGIARTNENESRYIRITDIDENGGLIPMLGATAKDYTDDYILSDNDFLFARSGATVGKTYLHKNIFPYKCFFAGYMIRVRVDEKKLLPDYLFVYTNTHFYQDWVDAIQRAAAQPNINAEEYANLLIPVPSLDVQKNIVTIYNDAKAKRREKLQESKQLLASIDTYLLNELGITIAPKENSLKNRIFTISSSYLTGRRWDCPSNSGTFSLHSQKFENRNLREIVIINPAVMFPPNISDVTFIPMESIDECYGEVNECLSKSVPETTGFTRFQQDDIIWAKITPCMQNGKAAIVRQTLNGYACGSTEFYVLRCNKNILDTEYLFNIMHMKQLRDFATCYFGGSAGQQRVSKDFLTELVIPVPPLSKQKEIAEHIKQIRSDAKRLQKEAEQILSDAKQQVEKMILGEQNNE